MSYTVVEPFLLLRDGAVVHYTVREVGKLVELSDAEAAELGGKVTPTDPAPSALPKPRGRRKPDPEPVEDPSES